MRRREFIAFVGSAAAGWPLFARAQQSTVPVIGFLHSGSPGSFTRHMAAFRQGLGETSYVEGQNVAIEYRWAEGQYDLLPALGRCHRGRRASRRARRQGFDNRDTNRVWDWVRSGAVRPRR